MSFRVECVSGDEELMVPQKVETGDTVKMKQVMDEAVIKAVRGYGSLSLGIYTSVPGQDLEGKKVHFVIIYPRHPQDFG